MTTADQGKQSAFEMLIQNGADPSLKDNDGCSLLHCAVKGGNTTIINKLLSVGVAIDSRNDDDVTPLMCAAYCDKQNAFEMLVQNAADPSLKIKNGSSLLHIAAQGGNTSIIEKL